MVEVGQTLTYWYSDCFTASLVVDLSIILPWLDIIEKSRVPERVMELQDGLKVEWRKERRS